MKRLCLTALALTLLLSGCKSAPAKESPAAESLSPVYADWSQLTPYEAPQAVYTRRYEDFNDTLTPAGDYGPLLPFQGASLIRHEYGFDDPYTLYGLATLEGEVIVDPVYTSAFALRQYGPDGQTGYDPYALLLTKTFPVPGGEPEARSAVCARDGSWCTDFLYTYDWELFYGMVMTHGIPLLKGDDQLVFLDAGNGTERRVIDIQPYRDMGLEYGWELIGNIVPGERYAPFSIRDPQGDSFRYYLADLDTGEALPLPGDVMYAGPLHDGLFRAQGGSGYGCLDEQGGWVIDPIYNELGDFYEGVAAARAMGGGWCFLDRQGTVLKELPVGYDSLYYEKGFWKCYGADVPDRLFRADLTEVELPQGAWDAAILGDGWVSWLRAGGGTTLWKDGVSRDLPPELGNAWSGEGGYALLHAPDAEESSLLNLETFETVPLPGSFTAMFQTDELTGERYIWTSSNELQCWRLFDLEGNLLSSQPYSQGGGQDQLVGGLLFHTRPDRCTLTTRDGEVVFQWLIPQASD